MPIFFVELENISGIHSRELIQFHNLSILVWENAQGDPLMIGLIGIDVDGTLLDSEGRIPDANCDAIHEAVARGIHVALVTGRSFPFARPIADPLPSSLSLIVSSGAVERTMDGATLARRLLDRHVARCLLDRTRGHRHAAALIFDRDADRQVMFETMDWEHPGRKGYWAKNRSLIAQCVPLEDALVEDPIQVMFNGGVDGMRRLADELRREAVDFAVSLTEYVHRDFSLDRHHRADRHQGARAGVARGAARADAPRGDGHR